MESTVSALDASKEAASLQHTEVGLKAAVVQHLLVSSLHLATPGHDFRRLPYAAGMFVGHALCSLHRSINPGTAGKVESNASSHSTVPINKHDKDQNVMPSLHILPDQVT